MTSDAPAQESETAFAGAVHGTSVAIGGQGVLIRGPSGAGKSDLALRLIDRGAVLLSDDYTQVSREGEAVICAAPEHIAGLIEVRGLGIVPLAHIPRAPLALIVILLGNDEPTPERHPSPLPTHRLCGQELPFLSLRGFEASAPIKIELALRHLNRQNERGDAMR